MRSKKELLPAPRDLFKLPVMPVLISVRNVGLRESDLRGAAVNGLELEPHCGEVTLLPLLEAPLHLKRDRAP